MMTGFHQAIWGGGVLKCRGNSIAPQRLNFVWKSEWLLESTHEYCRSGFDCENLMIVNCVFLEIIINRFAKVTLCMFHSTVWGLPLDSQFGLSILKRNH